jgi:four helix bundle protein
MGEISSYKDLLIWQKGIKLVKLTYVICQDFPKDEIFGLQSQIKRSSVSVPSNIAEGYGRNTSQSFIQFLRIARGSLLELETQLIIAKELDFVKINSFDEMSALITEESKMINGFIKSIENKK